MGNGGTGERRNGGTGERRNGGTEGLRKVEVAMRKGEAEERRKSECGNGERNGGTAVKGIRASELFSVPPFPRPVVSIGT